MARKNTVTAAGVLQPKAELRFDEACFAFQKLIDVKPGRTFKEIVVSKIDGVKL